MPNQLVREVRPHDHDARKTSARISVVVHAHDETLKAGILTALQYSTDIELLPAVDATRAHVSLVVAHQVDQRLLTLLHPFRHGRTRVGLVLGVVGTVMLPSLLGYGVVAMLPRAGASQEQLTHMVTAIARGERQISGAQPLPSTPTAVPSGKPAALYGAPLTPREVSLLQLAAEGFNTEEIAQKMSYSTRTVKNVLKHVTERFHLRNRTHAVAWAVRQGLI
ncbi:LuxR C-terminal-related transcriptional regulator [Saccharopolyspora sp. K220]|uniref:helix-turn-helix transcriptional regulator n=1 Tax=Saccharopolyspora soli TaxID=2926618 RepID=UPI001F57E80C|nr:LuxR C-terminal-related transcriptional regulator [Saccharopolyspora soli]MCI2422552.1 LuxR C-terminal-related transcriptional regulator [Saccharopolyspora soli]